MKWWCRWVGAAALIGGTIVCSAPSVGADVFRLAPWTGTLQAFVSYGRTDQDGETSENMNAQQQLTLENRGAYIVDPKIVLFNIGGTFGLQQQRQRTDFVTTSSDEFVTGTLWGYDVSAFILPEEATGLLLFANRNESAPPRLGAGTQTFLSESEGARLYLNRLYIPSRLEFRREVQKDEIDTGVVTSVSDYTDYVLQYDGERGWINSEMRISYEFLDHMDHISDTEFRQQNGRMHYTLDFGPDLNWRWDSRLSTSYRTGDIQDLTRVTAGNFLRIDHTDRLRTTYQYTLNYSESGGAQNLSNTGRVSLRHKLYESLETIFGVNGRYVTQQNGVLASLGGDLNLNYQKKISADGLLTAGLGVGFAYQSDQFADSTASAINEVHTVTFPVANPVQLDNPFVITTTVVVTKVVNGPLPPGCSPFSVPRTLTEGVDYTLDTAGQNLTEIVPIPCSLTTAGLNPGDTISVDYQYTVPQDSKFTTGTFSANIAVRYPWILAFASHTQVVQTLIQGDPGFLDNRRRDVIGAEVPYDKGDLRARLRGEFENFESDRQAYNAVRLNQHLQYTIMRDMTLGATALESFTKFSNPDDRTTLEAALRATLSYRIQRGLSASAFVGARAYDQTDQDLNFTGEVGLDMTWTIRQLTIRPSAKFLNRVQGDSNTKDYLFTLRVIRSF